jgi:hypothetical protein
MINELKKQALEVFGNLFSFLTKTIPGKLTLIGTFIGVLQGLGLIEKMVVWLETLLISLLNFMLVENYGVPTYYWITIGSSLALLFLFVVKQGILLSSISGVFRDDFKNGLEKWEFGGEGWKNERDGKEYLLSVSESPDGGITKKGFSWTDYEFSFMTKVVNKNVGWIVRAENRNKYLMIQLNLENSQKPRLRLHLRVPPSNNDYQWIVIDEKDITIKYIELMKWIKVKIIVNGSNIDTYLNDEHAAHYFIADPIRWQTSYSTQIKGKGNQPKVNTYLASINYSAGKVGFRCSGQHEHAHFRNVIVKPIIY